MKKYPSIPRVKDAPSRLFDEGHLWLLEKVDGANFRFQLQQSGLIQFGDRSRWFADPGAVPEPYQHAVRHIQEHLDRNALRHAVTDVEDVVFFGEAMHQHTVEYEWDRVPSFLGFDIWSAETTEFYPPDTVEQIFEQLGLHPVNVIERERRARDFDPEAYAVPQSAWYDGPAEGVVIRNKRGGRAKLLHPAFQDVDEAVPVAVSAPKLAAEFATERRMEKLAVKIENREQPVTVETLYERVLEDIVREEHKRLYHSGESVDMGTFRSEVGRLVRQFLETR
ncbi:RNA ligase family protein [Natronorubrum halophilum]|uniref:RNA ligase family protein n=1 Tax=Natronorubrum halophilum TaxID=1702106 RepID=UPI000EF65F9E|nr:RNA ligase family protein [Natronorubrum halophilum]